MIKFLISLSFVFLSLVNGLLGSPVIFNFTGLGGGQLDGTPFTQTRVTILIKGDSDDISVNQSSPNRTNYMIQGASSIYIGDIGKGLFVFPTTLTNSQLTVSPGPSLSFGGEVNDQGGSKTFFSLNGSGLIGYTLTVPFGPFFDASPNDSQFTNIPLDIGLLNLLVLSNIQFFAMHDNDDDNDDDGLADDWELEHFSSMFLNGDHNPDFDRLTNLQEFRTSHDPNVTDTGIDAIDVTSGWNLISIPDNVDNPTVQNLLNGRYVGALWTWSDKRFRNINSTDLLDHKKGYWVYFLDDSSLVIPLTID